jgi:hypothetical protein
MLNSSENLTGILRAAYPDVAAIDEVAYFGTVSSLYSALACSALFWPKLVEIEDAVFIALYGDDERRLKRRFPELVREKNIRPHTARWEEWVSTFNKFEIVHLFKYWSGLQEIVEPAAEALGEVLVQTWTARLRSSYPNRTFEVNLLPDDGDESTRVIVRQFSDST